MVLESVLRNLAQKQMVVTPHEGTFPRAQCRGAGVLRDVETARMYVYERMLAVAVRTLLLVGMVACNGYVRRVKYVKSLHEGWNFLSARIYGDFISVLLLKGSK